MSREVLFRPRGGGGSRLGPTRSGRSSASCGEEGRSQSPPAVEGARPRRALHRRLERLFHPGLIDAGFRPRRRLPRGLRLAKRCASLRDTLFEQRRKDREAVLIVSPYLHSFSTFVDTAQRLDGSP